ncbi:hypothetical protein EDB19DRAFT_1763892 [Suillus lakei]|nr:hypothetical protein EDB19DRAFT_1763892 [Suillus lakei]
MVGRITHVERAASNVDTSSFTSSRSIPLPNDKDDGYRPTVNPVSISPITGADSHHFYYLSDAPTTTLIPDGGTCDNVSSATLPDQLRELLPRDMDSSTQSLPSTIAPPQLQPALQYFSQPEQNADGRYSAAAKGKGKALPEEQFFFGRDPTNIGLLDDEDLLYPLPDFSSTDEWVAHTRPILQDYANRQIPLPLGQRVNVSVSSFLMGPCNCLPIATTPKMLLLIHLVQIGPQLIENFTDVHRWATEYFRARFGMPTVGSDIPVLLTIITNTFYEAHTQLIDSIAHAALGNMHARGAASLDIVDFAFGYDFEMRQNLPFAVESSSRIHDTVEQYRPRSPLELPVNLPVTTRSGRQIKVSKQAQAAALAESEKQTKARQRKKDQAKKEQELATSRLEASRAVSQEPQLNPSAAGVVVCTPSARIYHTPNNGSLYHTPLHGINGILRKVKANVVVFTGAKCPTCDRAMPPRIPVTPTNPPSASQSTSVNSNVSINWNSERAASGPAVSSNLRQAPVTVQDPLLAVPWPIGFPPSAFRASAPDAAGHVNTTAMLLEATTTGTQDSAQVQATSVRGGRRVVLRASSAPLTIVTPARPRPVAPASTADPTANPNYYCAHRSARPHRKCAIRVCEHNGWWWWCHQVAVAAFAHAYYSQYYTNQTATAGSTANVAANDTANIHAHTSGPSGTLILGAMGPTSTRAYYPAKYPSTTTVSANNAVNTAAGPSRGRAIDFCDPELWIAHVCSAGDLPGFAARVPVSVVRPAVAASNNRVHTIVASNSQVNTRRTKKRKLDAGE